MRLIDADARVTVQSFDPMNEEYNHDEMTVEKALDFATDEGCPPVVDAAPVKRGEWIEYPLCLGYVGAYSDDHIVCSNCKSVWSIIDNDTERFDYCPHCGAQMGGETDG